MEFFVVVLALVALLFQLKLDATDTVLSGNTALCGSSCFNSNCVQFTQVCGISHPDSL